MARKLKKLRRGSTTRVETKRKTKGPASSREACFCCGEPAKAFGPMPGSKACVKCAFRIFTLGSAFDPKTGLWEMFWVYCSAGKSPRYSDEAWLKKRARGADGKLDGERFKRLRDLREEKYHNVD